MAEYKIYTDGSHLDKRNNGRLGAGGVLVKVGVGRGELIDEFSEELTSDYTMTHFGSDKCSNPSAELIGVLLAIKAFGDHIKAGDTVIILADYLGVKEWMVGNWRVKEPYIAKIKAAIEEEVKKRKLAGRIEYQWVKAHQRDNSKPDVFWNNYVDSLAKGYGK